MAEKEEEGIKVEIEENLGVTEVVDVAGAVKDWEEGGKQGPKPGTPRWNEIYREAEDGKRAKAELLIERQERAKDRTMIEAMKEWNQNLVAAVDGVKEVVTSKEGDKDLEALEAKKVELMTAKKVAREKADFDAETKVDDDLVDVKFAIKEHKVKAATAATEKIKPSTKSDAVLHPRTGKELTADEVSTYKNFSSINWFSTEPKMRAAAVDIEKEVWNDPSFRFATIEEVLTETKTRVEKEFDYKEVKDNGRRNRGLGLVETEIGGRGRLTTVRLSAVETQLMAGFGIPQEEWAKQKALVQRSNSKKGGA